MSQFSREARLKKAIEPVRSGVYDFIIFDCPPSLGLLTVNALTAAEELIVPIQCEYYALEGLGQLLRNVSLVQQNINPGLRLSGIVMTMFDPRTKLSEQVVEEVQRFFGGVVYDVIIPRTVRLSEAPGFGQPITVYDDLPTVTVSAVPDTVLAQPPDEEEIEVPRVQDLVATAPEAPPEPKAESPDASSEEPEAEAQEWLEQLAAEAAAGSTVATTEEILAEAAHEAESQIDEDEMWDEGESPAPRVRPPSSPAPPGHLPERRVVVIDGDPDIDLRAGQEAPVPGPGAAPDQPAMANIGATLEESGSRKRGWRRLFGKGGE